jgi:hypothetical protein
LEIGFTNFFFDLVSAFKFAVVLGTKEKHVFSINHPPKFKLLKNSKDQHFSIRLVVNRRLVNNEQNSNSIMD